MLGVFDMSLGHQTSWTGCPYSLLHRRCSSLCYWKTRIWPGWPDGLERNCLWAVFPLSSLDGLERRCRRDIWALNELDSFSRLCHWGLGSCKIIHILISQSQHLSSTWWGLWLACFGRTGLVLSLWGGADLWLDGLCQIVLFVSLAAQQVSGRSDIYWPSWIVLKELYLVLDVHGGSQLGTGGLPWYVCHIAEAMLWPEHWGIRPSSCRHFWPSLPLTQWNHVRLMKVWWRCGMNEVKVTGKLSKLISVEGRSIVRHDNGGHAFSCKKFS